MIIKGNSVIYPFAIIEDDCYIDQSILFLGCTIKSGLRIENTIVMQNHVITKESKLL